MLFSVVKQYLKMEKQQTFSSYFRQMIEMIEIPRYIFTIVELHIFLIILVGFSLPLKYKIPFMIEQTCLTAASFLNLFIRISEWRPMTNWA